MKSLLVYPTPKNISYFWNLGSLLGMVLSLQIISGLLLTMYYTNSTSEAFSSLQEMVANNSWAFFIQSLHLNGSSIFFFLLYMHLMRGLFFKSYSLSSTWMVGVTLLLLSMLIAFMGYVLPFSNMSLWAATVITNLLGVFPIVGKTLVLWLWGNFYVGEKTLKLFFTFHFILPLILLSAVVLHVLELHKSGSSTLKSNINYKNSLPFIPFGVKDYLNLIPLFLLLMLCLIYPYYFTESDSYIPSNLMSSPLHITPEWYFLFAYAILRAVPNKMGGVVLLVLSVLAFFFLPFTKKTLLKNIQINNTTIFLFLWSTLTFLGSKGVEYPYLEMSQLFTFVYFFSLVLFLLF